MKKWEYHQVTLSDEGADEDRVMTNLGNEGWEIYQIDWDPFLVLCKRPLEEDSAPTLKPSRVVVNDQGEAVSYEEAKAHGIIPDVIFIRDDGWSLGASTELMGTAKSLWKDKWVTVIWHDTILSYAAFKTEG